MSKKAISSAARNGVAAVMVAYACAGLPVHAQLQVFQIGSRIVPTFTPAGHSRSGRNLEDGVTIPGYRLADRKVPNLRDVKFAGRVGLRRRGNLWREAIPQAGSPMRGVTHGFLPEEARGEVV
jgi:hypothetical protein